MENDDFGCQEWLRQLGLMAERCQKELDDAWSEEVCRVGARNIFVAALQARLPAHRVQLTEMPPERECRLAQVVTRAVMEADPYTVLDRVAQNAALSLCEAPLAVHCDVRLSPEAYTMLVDY